eukprot:1146365-Pelagomonas_calceolata.AAC.4
MAHPGQACARKQPYTHTHTHFFCNWSILYHGCLQGVYLGGIEAAAKMVAKKEADTKDFKWYARYAGWGPKQLERECKAGVWFTAAASAPLILSRPEGSASTLWHNVLSLMGGDYQELSINVRAQEERWKK